MATLLTLVGPPIQEPVTLNEAKLHLRLDTAAHDTLLLSIYLPAAREYVELRTGRQLMTARYAWHLCAFPSGIFRLPRPPLQAIDSIVYTDQSGMLRALDPATYVVEPSGVVSGMLAPAFGFVWPSVQPGLSAVRIEFTAGYGTTESAVPRALKAAVLLGMADLYEHAEGQSAERLYANQTLERLLWPYRVLEV